MEIQANGMEAKLNLNSSDWPGKRSGDRSLPVAWSMAVGFVALLVYIWLAPRVPGAGDSSEFMLVLAVDGVAHPPGYPLYTLLGHLFVVTAHALGAGWAFAANATATGPGPSLPARASPNSRAIESGSAIKAAVR